MRQPSLALQVVELGWLRPPRRLVVRSPDGPGDQTARDFQSPACLHRRHRAGKREAHHAAVKAR
jgi:hypothetical protein